MVRTIRGIRRWKGLLFLLTASSVIVGLFPSPALAHGGYPRIWFQSTVNWRFTEGFPSGGGQRDSVVQGTNQWTDTGLANFTWNEIGEVPNWTISTNCGATWGSGGSGNNTVNWKSIDGAGNVLADEFDCPTSGLNINKFWIRFDRDDASNFHWSGATPDDVPDNKYDGWATAAHEFGHATGFEGHIGATSIYCDGGPDHHTMCPAILDGKARQRILEVHDVNTFQSVY